MLRFTGGLLAAAMLLAGLGTPALAGKHNEKLNIGDKAPVIPALPGADDTAYGFDTFKDKDAVVVVFTCNQCPVAQAYNERFNQFVKNYKDKSVGFLAVNVNLGKSEDLPAMKIFAKENGLQFPYVWDKTQKSGKAYGATVTPHVFVLDKDRNVAYMGAWDDHWQNAEGVEKAYTTDAVEAILAGKAPKETETLQRGCGIKYE